MSESAKQRVLAELDPWDTIHHAPVRAKVNGADLSLDETTEIVRALGGVMCECVIPKPVAPAGMCPECGAEGPFWAEALARHEEKKRQKKELGMEMAARYKPVDLVPVLRDGIPDPVLLCSNLLYEGGLHCIAGAPDCGKTTLALWWALQLLREGMKVLFLDEEGGHEIVTERLGALGASCGDLGGMMYIPFPGRAWDDGDITGLMEVAEGHSPAMVLLDSSAAFLARAGLDENQAPDVTNWWSRALTPLARQLHAAVLVIDHDVKATEQSRYARGSGAKLAAIDVQYKAEMIKPFTRNQEGILKLHVTKDRRGWLHREWRVQVKTGDGRIIPEFAHDFEEDEQQADRQWPPARRKLFEVLSVSPLTGRELVDRVVEKFGHGLTRETVSREMNALLQDGMAERLEHYPGSFQWMRTE